MQSSDELLKNVWHAMRDAEGPSYQGSEAFYKPMALAAITVLAEHGFGDTAVARADGRREGLEEAAKVADDYLAIDHAAADQRSGIFPKQSPIHEYIASAIRALIDASPSPDASP